jgi:hypothetical protein
MSKDSAKMAKKASDASDGPSGSGGDNFLKDDVAAVPSTVHEWSQNQRIGCSRNEEMYALSQHA